MNAKNNEIKMPDTINLFKNKFIKSSKILDDHLE